MTTTMTITSDKLRQAADFLAAASQLIRDAVGDSQSDQAYFFTEEWQREEREVDELLEAKKYQEFNSVEELIADLHRHA